MELSSVKRITDVHGACTIGVIHFLAAHESLKPSDSGFETAADGALLHGEAVGLGLVAACRISTAVAGTRSDLAEEVTEALRATGLPTDLDRWLVDDVLARVQVDKKRIGANLRFIVARDVGVCEVAEIAVTEVRRILRPDPTA